MARPRRLTEEERARSNALRQARWRARHVGLARLKDKNRVRKREREVEVGGEIVLPPPKVETKEEQETSYVGMDEVEGDEKVMREHREMMERRLAKQAPVERGVEKVPKRRVVHTENEMRTYEKLVEMTWRKKNEVEVEM
jgi:hypothetical protein